MAEFIVNSVLYKLLDAVVKEILLLHGVDQQVETVRCELLRIRAALINVANYYKHITDDHVKHWVNEVTDVAYSIEDVLDTFLLDVPQKPQSSRMNDTMMSRIIKNKNKKVPSVHKLEDEMKQIQKKLNEIQASSRVMFGIINPVEGLREPMWPLVQPDIDPDIVGFEADRDYLVKKLLDETTKRRYEVSIWGLGGLGKTTLAQKVYNCIEVKQLFEVRIWVTISQNYKVIDVINEIVRQLSATTMHSEEKKHNATTVHSDKVHEGLKEIHTSLRKKKYLIVLDDIWTKDLWILIEMAFPDDNNGSRVLTTTRSSNAGLYKGGMGEFYKLAPLPEKLSRELLLKRAFPNLDPNKDSFDDLSDILDQFIHKCDGLPLALVVLGGLLSTRERSNIAWNRLFRTMSWHNEGKLYSETIATSYEDLPDVLKMCFMYFAAFPKDYNIHAPSLIQIWIAEGFITKNNHAEDYLEDLVRRSMVQFVHRSNRDGSIKYIRIHNLLLDVAINKAEENNFLVVCSRADDQRILSARRVAIHNVDCADVILSQNLRSLLFFGHGRMPNCSKQRLLRVVTGDCHDTKIELGMFKELPSLRYLRLNGDVREAIYEEQQFGP